jgi:uncharacterized protein YbbC (DUF1343 family)
LGVENNFGLNAKIESGLDRVQKNPSLLEGLGRVALITNQAVCTSHFVPCVEVIHKSLQQCGQSKLVSVFGPQHGYFQTEQYNMAETADETIHVGTQEFPLYSLYSEVRIPKAENLHDVDTLIVDLLDVGCRVYTYMLTMAGCLKAAAKLGKKVVILDRPNPQGLARVLPDGSIWGVEGHVLENTWESFVSWYPLPMKHGMTMGELARYFKKFDSLDVNLTVIECTSLSRKNNPAHERAHCRNTWTVPSPNLPTHNTALLFPAFVIFEGTNLCEGRGTTLPFQSVGAPFVDANKLKGQLEEAKQHNRGQAGLDFSDVAFRRHDFRPTFYKHAGLRCQGLQFHAVFSQEQLSENCDNTSVPKLNTFALGALTLALLIHNHPKDVCWRDPGYEYNNTDNPIHLIYGTTKWFELFESIRKGRKSAQGVVEDVNLLLLEAHKVSSLFFQDHTFALSSAM